MNKKVYNDIMSGHKDNNIRFFDLRKVLEDNGFTCRIRGDHFIYKNPEYPERINIQPVGNKAKAYQVKQVRAIFEKYNI